MALNATCRLPMRMNRSLSEFGPSMPHRARSPAPGRPITSPSRLSRNRLVPICRLLASDNGSSISCSLKTGVFGNLNRTCRRPRLCGHCGITSGLPVTRSEPEREGQMAGDFSLMWTVSRVPITREWPSGENAISTHPQAWQARRLLESPYRKVISAPPTPCSPHTV